MNEKIKVSKEVFEALNELLKVNSEDQALYMVSQGDSFTNKINCTKEELEAIKTLRGKNSCIGLAKMLIFGYELELTKEERILEIFKVVKEVKEEAKVDDEIKCALATGYAEGIYTILNELKIEIEGINK